MIEKIIDWSARNKYLVLLLGIVVVSGAFWTMKQVPLDAIPDLSDTQVIIYSKWDRSPDLIEDQVTYPIVTSLLGTPKVKAVRGVTDFGFSYVYVIFQDGTDLYWARSRVLEYLSKIQSKLPQGVQVELGPDATSVGWVYQYALIDESKRLNLSDLRSLQDWNLKFHLQSVPGVSEVASVGGYVKQYQVIADPNRLLAAKISILQLANAVRRGNNESGGRVMEIGGAEYMIRGRGYFHGVDDIENVVVALEEKTKTPILVKHLGKVVLGPEMRRGVTDLDGDGDTVGGVIIMRQGENALNVIDAVKSRIKELEPSLPDGVKIITTYDRSDLIKRAIETLKHELTTEMIIVSLVILLFLWHIPSAIVPIITIPVSVVIAFIPMYFMGITTNIMSMAGIAISIGVLVDGAIIEVENAYKRIQEWNAGGRKEDFHEVRIRALKEVGPTVFFSLLVIAVSFIPVFTLVDQEGRLFRPLAISKTLAMLIAAILAVTVDPAMRMLFARMDDFKFRPIFLAKLVTTTFVGKYYDEEHHPISKRLFQIYDPVVSWVLRRPKTVIAAAAALVLSTLPIFLKLGSEFMPPLQEGAFLYMPTAFPGMAVSEAARMINVQDQILMQFPEVKSVFGKAGRADSSTDPAPFNMVETTVQLKPQNEWPPVPRWYSTLPNLFHPLFTWIIPEHKSYDELQEEMNAKLQFPGMPNIWTMPIKNRVDMLSTGIRTPIGVKVLGSDPVEIQRLGELIENSLRDVSGTRSVLSERSGDGYYIDYEFDRKKLAVAGISIEEAQMTIASAIGGENVTTLIEGRQRFPVNVRYDRDFRQDLDSLRRVLVETTAGTQIPVSQIAEIKLVKGPAMLRDEGGMLAGYVYVDVMGRDLGGYVQEAKEKVAREVKIPAGYTLQWSGQYENMIRVKERLKIILPLTLFLIALLLFFNTKSMTKTAIVLLAVPFSVVGSVWLLYFLGYNLSIAVWVGMIALMGLDAETGVFMLLYLDIAYKEGVDRRQMNTLDDLRRAIKQGAVKRIRPKFMTVMAAFMGLLPIMWSTGAGGDVMKRIAAPMVGGLVSSFALELIVYPAVFFLWKKKRLVES